MEAGHAPHTSRPPPAARGASGATRDRAASRQAAAVPPAAAMRPPRLRPSNGRRRAVGARRDRRRVRRGPRTEAAPGRAGARSQKRRALAALKRGELLDDPGREHRPPSPAPGGGSGRTRRRRRPSRPEAGDDLVGRQVQVLVQHLLHLVGASTSAGWPRSGTRRSRRRSPSSGPGRQPRRLASPAFAAAMMSAAIRMCSRSEPGQLVAGRLAVERLDRVADVGLVLEQPPDRRLRVGRVRREADDREPRPGDVVFPQLAHVVSKRELLSGDRAPRGMLSASVRQGVRRT